MADQAAGINNPTNVPPPPPPPNLNLRRTTSNYYLDSEQIEAVNVPVSPSSNVIQQAPPLQQPQQNALIIGQKKPSDVARIVKPFETTKNNLINKDILSFRDFFDTLEKTFWAYKTRYSSSLDLIAIYLKGQKILYIESKVHCENNLNVLMIPAICISAVCTVLSVSIGDIEYSKYVISGLTAFNSFILAMISYLKLDAKAEAHRVSAYKFDKLQTKCEFFSGKIMYNPDLAVNTEEVLGKKMDDFIDSLEKNIVEIKEINQFVIPQTIRYRYPKLFSTNIFSEIKKKRNFWKVKINKLNETYNKITEIIVNPDADKKEENISKLNKIKEDIIFESINFNSEILCLDTQLTREIERYIEYKRKHRWYHCILHFFGFGKSYMRNELDFSEKQVQTENFSVSASISH